MGSPRASIIRLKRRRFEVGFAVVMPLVVAAWGASILGRLAATGATRSCIENWARILESWPAADGASAESCLGPMRAWNELMIAEGDKFMAIMALLPFVAGLLAAGPIVARECEDGTARLAWWLYPSRRRWLLAEIGPVLALVLPATAVAAVVATQIADLRALGLGLPAAPEMALHGPLAVARAVAAVGLGLLVGALLQRVVPALVVGALLCWALAVAVGPIQNRWLLTQESVPLAEGHRGFVTGWGWMAPDGAVLGNEAAMALVPESVSKLDVDDPQRSQGFAWLAERGYRLTTLGVPDDVVTAGWAPCEGILFVGAGLLAFGGSLVLVERIRPR